jgi:hypothetical protein
VPTSVIGPVVLFQVCQCRIRRLNLALACRGQSVRRVICDSVYQVVYVVREPIQAAVDILDVDTYPLLRSAVAGFYWGGDSDLRGHCGRCDCGVLGGGSWVKAIAVRP